MSDEKIACPPRPHAAMNAVDGENGVRAGGPSSRGWHRAVRSEGVRHLASHLRFTVEEYESIQQVSGLVILGGLLSDFQRSLVPALRKIGAGPLADRVAALPTEQLHVLRYHLDAGRRGAEPDEERPAVTVSHEEWQAIDRVCRLVLLRAGDLDAFRQGLIRGLAEETPVLAEKLSLLDDAGISGLLRRARSGRRWCP